MAVTIMDYPEYNPWDAAEQGQRVGTNMRRLGQQAEVGRAYQTGGADAAYDAAAGQGNFDVAEGITQMQARREDHQMAGMRRLREFGGFATSALRRAQALPPEQRATWINQPHIRSRFENFGFTPEQIDKAIQGMSDPATADAVFQNLYAAFQGDGLDWSVMDPKTGQIGAIEPNTGQYVEGGQAPIGAGQEWRPATPEELQAWGIPSGAAIDVNIKTGQRRTSYRPNAPRSGQGQGYYEDDGYDYEGG